MPPEPERTVDDSWSGGDPDLDELLVDYLDRAEAGGDPAAALEAVCAENPERAGDLRSAVHVLADFGVMGESRSAAPEPPRALGDFEIVREIGRGGMGVVYEAREVALDRRVAVKVLLAHLTNDERTVERFRREGKTVGALQHPSIVQIFAVGQAGGHHYLSMEFVEGAALDRVLQAARKLGLEGLTGATLRAAISGQRHRLTRASDGDESKTGTGTGSRIWGRGHIELCAETVARVADALEHAHGAGIIHRDVKPSNILVRPDGTPVLTDFGLARRDDEPGLTRSGVVAGTPAYMAPEQTVSGQAVDARTDVFSLGATLYELLTLERPFPGETTHELIRRIQQQEPVDPQKLNRRVPADLAAVVLKALEKDPKRRYQTAAELADDLRAFLEYRPVRARRASAWERTRRWAVRQPFRAAVVVLVALGVPTVAGLTGYLIANRELVAAGEEKNRREQVDAAIDAAYVDGFGTAVRDRALEQLRGALGLEPDNSEAIAGMAMLLLDAGSGRPTPGGARAALAFLDERTPLVAGERALQRIRAWCLEELGRGEEARAELERLGEPATALEAFWAGMRTLELSLPIDSTEAQRRAFGYLQDAVMLAPRPRVAYHYYLAAAAGELQDKELAQRAADALVALWPDTAYAWQGAGVALYEVHPARAVKAYRKALEFKDRPEYRGNLANALSTLGRSDEAVEQWRAALALKPDYALALYNLGREYFARRGDPEAAVPHLRRCVELEPRLLDAHHYLIWALSRLGRRDEALAAAKTAREALPDQPLILRDIANIHGDRGDIRAAVEAVQSAVELAPRDHRNYEQLADLHVARGDVDAALRAREKAVEVAEGRDRALCREMLAWFLLQEHGGLLPLDAARALRIAEELVAETRSEQPWFLELLGMARYQNGAVDAALKTYRQARDVARSVETASRKNLEKRLDQRIDRLEKELTAR